MCRFISCNSKDQRGLINLNFGFNITGGAAPRRSPLPSFTSWLQAVRLFVAATHFAWHITQVSSASWSRRGNTSNRANSARRTKAWKQRASPFTSATVNCHLQLLLPPLLFSKMQKTKKTIGHAKCIACLYSYLCRI